ncbi:hypothetical protein [Arenicella xantha]|uniref:Uncharacterized protein n=1 Tax=Arenicella xantha TaxID=644221 RepID=A0A395JKN7_9GAMM|nr:hypothetical protein [Arenicella xantha]RBP50995.1 hypothetical protein DFR28_102412 [Arenicella xantha]
MKASKGHSTPYQLGQLEAQKFVNELLLDRLSRNDEPNLNEPLAEPQPAPPVVYSAPPSVYKRLAETESELANAQRFIHSLSQSRAYRLMMKTLRLLGRTR